MTMARAAVAAREAAGGAWSDSQAAIEAAMIRVPCGDLEEVTPPSGGEAFGDGDGEAAEGEEAGDEAEPARLARWGPESSAAGGVDPPACFPGAVGGGGWQAGCEAQGSVWSPEAVGPHRSLGAGALGAEEDTGGEAGHQAGYRVEPPGAYMNLVSAAPDS